MLAATYSRASDALQGGDIGWRNLQSLPNVMADVLKESPRKGVYIIKGKDSWDVMRVSDTRDGVQFKLAGGPVEQTHARHILMLVSDITPEGEVIHRLNDIKRRIDAGESDFATMARLHSVDNSATRGGDLGWLQPGDTVPEFEKAMNSLKPNEVSGTDQVPVRLPPHPGDRAPHGKERQSAAHAHRRPTAASREEARRGRLQLAARAPRPRLR